MAATLGAADRAERAPGGRARPLRPGPRRMPTPSATPPPCPGGRGPDPSGSVPRWPRWPSSRARTPPARSLDRLERPPDRAVPLPRQGHHGHHRAPGGRHPVPRAGRWSGAPSGWLAWLGLHLVYLVGFRNKIVVLVNWSWRYLSWGSGPRVIVGDVEREPADGPGRTEPRARWRHRWPGREHGRGRAGPRSTGVDDASSRSTARSSSSSPWSASRCAGATHCPARRGPRGGQGRWPTATR